MIHAHHHHHDHGSHALSHAESATLVKRASLFSVGVAVTLIAAKLVAWMMTDALSLLSSLTDSVLDLMASMLTVVAVRYALQPPDDEHRFGHGKAESLAALAQAAFVAGSAAFLLTEAAHRFWHPVAIQRPLIGVAVSGFSVLMTVGLLAYQRHTVAHTGSTAIKADAMHYQTDVLVNGAVLLSLLASWGMGWHQLDVWCSLGIAAYILWSAWQIAKDAFHHLMDHEMPEAERNRIQEMILAHPQTKGVHALKTRYSGMHPFIQFHLELDGSLTLYQAHVISSEIEESLLRAFPRAEILIHEDPEDIEEAHREGEAA
jgi:ferrous-iron efflux pump FieF